MRKSLFVVLVMLIAAVIACGGSTGPVVDQSNQPDGDQAVVEVVPTAEPQAPQDPTEPPTATPAPTEPPAVGSARTNPIPVGQTGEVPTFNFVVNDVTRPADEIVRAANPFNPAPGDGQEYIMVDISVTCIIEECEFFPAGFDVLGTQGTAYVAEVFVTGVDGKLEYTELFRDAQLTGLIFFIVNSDDANLALRWEPLLGERLYFALGEFDPAAEADAITGELPDVEPIATSRENPAPFGTPLRVPTFIFTVLGVTRPANDIVLEANPFNPQPEEGQEYVMVELDVICAIEECSFFPASLTIVGSANIASNVELFVSGVEDKLEGAELLQGASASGSVFFIVPQSETGLILRWEPFAGDEAFLSLEP